MLKGQWFHTSTAVDVWVGGPGAPGLSTLEDQLLWCHCPQVTAALCSLPTVLSVARRGLPGEQRPLPKLQRLSKQLRPWRRVCDLSLLALPGMMMAVGSLSGLLLCVFFPLVAWHQFGCQGG